MKWTMVTAYAALCLLPVAAETGHDAWLRYPYIKDAAVRRQYDTLPAVVVATGASPILASARAELIRGVRGMLGRTLRIESSVPKEGAIVLGSNAVHGGLKDDGFLITRSGSNLLVTSANDAGVLYGTFALLRTIALHQPIVN